MSQNVQSRVLRLGTAPEWHIGKKNGTKFCTARGCFDSGHTVVEGITVPKTVWVSLVAFEGASERLAAGVVGQSYKVEGAWQSQPYVTKSGEERQELKCIVQSFSEVETQPNVRPVAPLAQVG